MLDRREAIFGSIAAAGLFQHRQTSHSTPDATPVATTKIGHLWASGELNLPIASEGTIDIVLTGDARGPSVPFVFHNNTSETHSVGILEGVALRRDGTEYSISEVQMIVPSILDPGDYGIGIGQFSSEVEDAHEVQLELSFNDAEVNVGYEHNALITKLSRNGSDFVGTYSNPNKFPVSSAMLLVCITFDDEMKPLGWDYSYEQGEGKLEPDASRRFSFWLRSDASHRYLFGAVASEPF